MKSLPLPKLHANVSYNALKLLMVGDIVHEKADEPHLVCKNDVALQMLVVSPQGSQFCKHSILYKDVTSIPKYII